MMKKTVQRSLLGFPLGVFIAYTITVAISFFQKDGSYLPVVPSLTVSMGGELNAVVLQYILSGILGVGFAAGSVIWENEDWSILKRTVTHWVVTSVVMFPIAYISRWMEHTIAGIVSYILIFMAIYVVIWLAQYIAWRRKVQEINQKLQSK